MANKAKNKNTKASAKKEVVLTDTINAREFDCVLFASNEVDRTSNEVCIKCQSKHVKQYEKCISTMHFLSMFQKAEKKKTGTRQKTNEAAIFIIDSLKADKTVNEKIVKAQFDNVSSGYAKSLNSKIKGVYRAISKLNDDSYKSVYKTCCIALITDNKKQQKKLAEGSTRFMLRTAKRYFADFATEEIINEYLDNHKTQKAA